MKALFILRAIGACFAFSGLVAVLSYAGSFTGDHGDGYDVILQAPDGHCAHPVLADDNTVTWENVSCGS